MVRPLAFIGGRHGTIDPVTVTSTSLALLILCLMTFRSVLQKYWTFARTSHYDRVVMLMGLALLFLIALNPEFWQPPSRLLSEF
jgi:type II secretory pathway component PulM